MGLHEYANIFMMGTKIYLTIVIKLSKEKCLNANTTLKSNCFLYINMYTCVGEWSMDTHKVQEGRLLSSDSSVASWSQLAWE